MFPHGHLAAISHFDHTAEKTRALSKGGVPGRRGVALSSICYLGSSSVLDFVGSFCTLSLVSKSFPEKRTQRERKAVEAKRPREIQQDRFGNGAWRTRSAVPPPLLSHLVKVQNVLKRKHGPKMGDWTSTFETMGTPPERGGPVAIFI